MGITGLSILPDVTQNDAAAASRQPACQQGLPSQHCRSQNWKCTSESKDRVLTWLRSRRGKKVFFLKLSLIYKVPGEGKLCNKKMENPQPLRGHYWAHHYWLKPWAGHYCGLLATGGFCEIWLCSCLSVKPARHLHSKSGKFGGEANREWLWRASCWQLIWDNPSWVKVRASGRVTQLMLTGSGKPSGCLEDRWAASQF